MEITLVGINSRSLHVNIAIRYLYSSIVQKFSSKNVTEYDIDIIETNINEPMSYLFSSIYKKSTDIYCFSTYIWNIEICLKLIKSIKNLSPNAVIILGGPEASFRFDEFMSLPEIDFVIRGDGEIALPDLLLSLMERVSSDIDSSSSLVSNRYNQVDTDLIPFPYIQFPSLLPERTRVMYYESSRGCPFSCSYCLSSSMYNVSFRSLDKVFVELKFLLDKEFKVIKFVDRTWNVNIERSIAILNFIKENPSNTCFHFEIAADLLTEELIELIATLPKDAIQFEIGVQSANLKTLNEVCRKTDLIKLKNNVARIMKYKNVHIHMDLIAGLPFEDFSSFRESFDFVMELNPNMLQLGFLKLLHGSNLRRDRAKYDLIIHEFSPYEVISNKWISYEELRDLKLVEDLLELLYNSEKMFLTLSYAFKSQNNMAFDLLYSMSKHLDSIGFFQQKNSIKKIFNDVHDYFKINYPDLINELIMLMKIDWIESGINSPTPDFFKNENEVKKKNELISENRNLFKDILLVDVNQQIYNFLSNRGFFDKIDSMIDSKSEEKKSSEVNNTSKDLISLIFSSSKGKSEKSELIYLY